MITQKYLKECVSYDPVSGHFTWLERPGHHFKSESLQRGWNKRFAGKRAGSFDKRQHRISFSVDDRTYIASRMAWFYVYGTLPTIVDHKNRFPADNSIENLRAADQTRNSQNSTLSRRNSSGFKGVSFDAAVNKWTAQIIVNGARKNLGRFLTIREAKAAHDAASKKHFGEFATDGENAPVLEPDERDILIATLRTRLAAAETDDKYHAGYLAGSAVAAACRARADRAAALLKPFAEVAERDIGSDEANTDFFRPISHENARSPLLTVGDLRAASAFLRGKDNG